MEDVWKGVFGWTTGRGDLWEEGCHKQEGAGCEFLSTLVHASAAGSPWITLKNLNNPPLGQKVSCFGFFSARLFSARSMVGWWWWLVSERGTDAVPVTGSSSTCFLQLVFFVLFFILLGRTLERGLKGRLYLPV